jgi:hypothetical protein
LNKHDILEMTSRAPPIVLLRCPRWEKLAKISEEYSITIVFPPGILEPVKTEVA